MHLSKSLFLLAATSPLVFAVPIITVPAGPLAGGTAFTVTWADDQVAPLLSALSTYTLQVMAGSNSVNNAVYSLPSAAFSAATANSVTVTVPATAAGPGTNAYFISLLSVATAGGIVQTYSSHFTLTGMTGTFAADVLAAVTAGIPDGAGPGTVNNAVTALPGAAATVPAAAGPPEFLVPYTMQTGAIRYAPMQPVPPNSITATDTAPLFPTSSVVIATTFLPIPTITVTSTQAGTFVVSSHANTAAAASSPTDPMQRFLNRWKD